MMLDSWASKPSSRLLALALTGSTLIASVSISVIFWYRGNRLQEEVRAEREHLRRQLQEVRDSIVKVRLGDDAAHDEAAISNGQRHLSTKVVPLRLREK
jgi:hypothetical protein